MFYLFSRFISSLAIKLFLKSVKIINSDYVKPGKPYLLASNHSGSFFDAIVIGQFLVQPIHTFTRADVFRNPRIAKWLRRINLIPAYRGTEGGREYLLKNEESFRMVRKMFGANACIVIFSEGIAANEWKLRPLAKGTGRLAWQTWFGENPILEMEVVPTGLTYEHYLGANKNVLVQYGEPICHDTIPVDPNQPEKWLRAFNQELTKRMRACILETPDGKPDPAQLEQYIPPRKSNPVFQLIGKIGRLVNRPIYRLFFKPIYKKTEGTVFFDSVLYGSLLYIYPVIIALLSLIMGVLTSFEWAIATFIGMPVLAWFGNQYR